MSFNFQKQNERQKLVQQRVAALLADLGIQRVRAGFGIGGGWLPLVEETLRKLIEMGWNRHLAQVKQKFGQLCIYTGPLTPEMKQVVKEACKKADMICEECGKPHGLKVPLSGLAICKECEEEYTA
jgi:hypothetical protein